MRKEAKLLRVVFIAGLVFFSSIQLYAQSVVLTEMEVKEDDSAVKILYATNRSVAVECYDLSVPPQIIVDFMGDVYSKQPEITMVNKGVVKQMRVIKGTKTSPDLDAAYYPVDFIILDLKEAVRYDFDQGLTTSVLIVSKPGKTMQQAQAAKEDAAINAANAPRLEFVKKEVVAPKPPVVMDEKEYEQTFKADLPAQVEKKNIAAPKPSNADKPKSVEPKKKKSLKKKMFGKPKEKTPEQIKAQLEKEQKKQDKIKQAEIKKAAAAKKRALRAKKPGEKSVPVRKNKVVKVEKKKQLPDPSKQVEAAQKKVAELESEILKAEQEIKTADENIQLAEKDQSTIAERIEFSKAKVELAKNAYDTSVKHLQLSKSATNSVWVEYSNVKAKLSSYLENAAEEKIINDTQKAYDQKKVELEDVIKAAEVVKKENDAKLEEYNKLKQESEALASDSQNPAKKVVKAKEVLAGKEIILKEKQAEMKIAKQELEDANLALKRYELDKADEEYKKSVDAIDSEIIQQMEEEQKKAEEEKRLAEEAKIQQMEDDKLAEEARLQKLEQDKLSEAAILEKLEQEKLEQEKLAKERIRLEGIKNAKAKEDAQMAALKALDDERKQKEESNKRAVSKRAEVRPSSRKVNMPEKKPVKEEIGLRGEVLESAVELRNAGLEMQRNGDFDSAVKYYQQALMQDPKYATVHNDLGILYEQKGLEDKAKMEYLTTLKIDPQYIKAHSNLALLYEKSGDYKKAYYHWKQRVNLGREDDPWTLKAKQRMQMLENRK